MYFNIIIIFVVCYLIGCIPFALIWTKWFAQKNPGYEGSGNYGALNSYEITNKKYIGILVFICDCLKGALAVWFAWNCIFPNSLYIVIASLSVVLGHTFNIFLKFKGGRGLSTALGATLMYNPFVAIIWVCLWFLFNRIVKKDVIFDNNWATLITPIVVNSAPGYIFFHANYNYYVTFYDYKIFSILLCTIIFAAHLRKK
jgi:acyl-phosphate glycerol 3-phosphate acyltransferase